MKLKNKTCPAALQALAWAATSMWACSAYAAPDPLVQYLQSEATTLFDENQVTLGTDGTAAGAIAGPCFTGLCLPTPLGNVQASYTPGNRNGQTSAGAVVSIGGIASAQAAATLPTSTTQTPGGYALSDNSATATEDGTTGSLAAAASASWDTLTFQGAGAGQTGTLSLTLSLATPASASTDVGTGGGCIAFGGSVCDPFTNTIRGAGATETFTATVPLDTPLLVFDALYTVADNDFNIETTTIDPNLVLSLPAGVTFSTVSGNGGGSSSSSSSSSGPSTPGVPEPGTLALFGAAGLALAARMRRRKSRAA